MKQGRSGTRFLMASIAALAMDYVLTLMLFHWVGLSLAVSAGTVFLFLGLAFYFVHEFWTFKSEASAFSLKRMCANLTVLVAAGSVRVGVIWLLESLRAPEGLWVSLYFAIAVACSFTANFLLNRHFVFRR